MDELTTSTFKITSSMSFDRSRRFYRMEYPEWVQIVPITTEGKVVLVKQYRYGIDSDTFELPAGMAKDEDLNPLYTARRELLEETGYGGGQWISMGWVHPNPSIQNNRCHIFLAKNVEKVTEVNNDIDEDTQPLFVLPETVEEWIRSGQITHSLSISTFYLYKNLQRN